MCFFFNDTATTEIYTLSLHDALPICADAVAHVAPRPRQPGDGVEADRRAPVARDPERSAPAVGEPGSVDRKSTRLNSSHANISYAVFCLKKKYSQSYSSPDTLPCYSS